MVSGGVRNLKHKGLYEWYNKQADPKPIWTVFSARVLRYGYSKEQALKIVNLGHIKRKNDSVDDNGRKCTVCGEYKTWEYFSKNRNNKLGYTVNCKECRNKAKAEYRKKTNSKWEKEYRAKTRKLKIGQLLILKNDLIDIYEVIDYKFKKGYTIKSIYTGEEMMLDTNDNKRTNKNSKKFYMVDGDKSKFITNSENPNQIIKEDFKTGNDILAQIEQEQLEEYESLYGYNY